MITASERAAAIKQYAQSGILPNIEQWAKDLCAPIWWNEDENPAAPRKSGTVCFVHTGSRLIGVTADHVHAAISERLNAGLSDWCQIGGITFDPRARLIDRDPAIDIATYDLSAIQVAGARRNVHHAPAWPPAALCENDICVVGGWPWGLSVDRAPALVAGRAPFEQEVDRVASFRTHAFLYFIALATDVSPDRAFVHLGTATSTPWGRTKLPPGTNIGGMSGGPVFRYTERPGVISTLTLHAIVSDYALETVKAVPLSAVSADGRIRRDVVG